MRAIVTVTPWKSEPITCGVIVTTTRYPSRLGGLLSAVDEGEAYARAVLAPKRLVVWETQVEWIETCL